MKPIIKVENISKRYRVDGVRSPHTSLREYLTDSARSSVGKVRQLVASRGRGSTSERNYFWALKDVNFEVTPGEVVGIIGRNGAGKSTLLKVLSRITEPTSGRVELYGRVSSLLEVGTGFHPDLTGRENTLLNGAILGMSRAEIKRKFDEIVDFAEINHFIDTPVKHYSSGMYTRLAFSVAAHLQPEILIVDEVLAVGDAQFQKKCLGKMGEAARSGRTVLFVSHNMEAVRKLCSRGVLLESGHVTAFADTESVVKKYIGSGESVQSLYEIPLPPDYGDLPGYTRNLAVEDVGGNAATAIPVGQSWQVRVHFRINRRTEHLIIALGMRTSDGTPFRTSWSTPQTLEAGDYEVVFREETIIMAPGRYSLVVGLSAHERVIHYQEDVGILEIAEFSEGIDLVRLSGVGSVLNPLGISIRRVEEIVCA